VRHTVGRERYKEDHKAGSQGDGEKAADEVQEIPGSASE
jgi:hypothetical protein